MRLSYYKKTYKNYCLLLYRNRDKLDDRRGNLRIVSHATNMINRGKNKNNTSGHKGIMWDKRKKAWLAQISKNYKHIYIGRFDKIEDAIAAYNKVASEIHK